MKDLQTPENSGVEDDEIGKLISLAGPRLIQDDTPDPAAFAQAEAAWKEAVVQHKKRSRRSYFETSRVAMAMAACLLVAFVTGSTFFSTDSQQIAATRSAASVLNATGDYRLTLASSGAGAVVKSEVRTESGSNTRSIGVSELRSSGFCHASADTACVDVPQGSLLVAGENTFLWLELANSALLYAQPGSEMTLQNDGSIWLHSGRVYVDASADSAHVTIVTKHSKVVDIGTEYEVSVDADVTEVRTREGSVEVTTASTRYLSNANTETAEVVAFDGSGQLISKSAVSVDDSSWGWRHQAIAPFILEGRSVEDLVLWIARVEGSELDFATKNTRFSAGHERLSGGSILAKNALADGVETVNAATGFNLVVSERRLLLQRK